MRGIGATDAFRGFLPDIVVPVFALITQLGDVWFVFAVLAVLYWSDDRLPGGLGLSRSRAAFALALGLGALALTVGLKELFGLPRPPMPGDAVGLRYVPNALRGAYINAATASGYGFPSGHALTTTVVWGGLATVLDAGTPRRRWGVAGTVIILVCLARVVLGVHYLVDVIAGVAIGLAYLAVVIGFARGRPRLALWLAAAIAVVGAIVDTPATFDNAAALGGTVGAAAAWELLGQRVPRHLTDGWVGVVVAVGVVVLGGGFAAIYAVTPGFVITTLATGAVLGGAVALPVVMDRAEKRIGRNAREERMG